MVEVINREQMHGDFSDHATTSQNLKYNMRESKNWNNLTPVMREALEMIQHKIARILNGDPSVPDHWNDIIGYASRVSERLAPVAKPIVKKTIGGMGAYGDEENG